MVLWLVRLVVRDRSVCDGPVVWLLDTTAPADRIGRRIWQVLREHGPMCWSEVVGEVAVELAAEDQRSGAWAVDVGILGPFLYQPDVQQTLRTLVGRSVVIERAD